jgi:uncharacterized protein YdeI (YjbR/CyaY-like superfamily)
MSESVDGLPILAFPDASSLRAWLEANHATSSGVWIRIYKQTAGVVSVTFDEVLDQGLCFGWSESKRDKGDRLSYLQRFTPRRVRGTASSRNKERARRLIAEGLMTSAGLEALDL